MAIVLATVRHSGSHFALNILEQFYLRHAMTEDWRRDIGVTQEPLWFSHCEPEGMPKISTRMVEADNLVLVMRNPMDVARSWIKRDVVMGQWFRSMWINLFILKQEYSGIWLTVDTHDRERRLEGVSLRLGVKLRTDWKPLGVTGNNYPYKKGMTLEQCAEFFKTLPFEQFGYMEKGMVKKVAKKKVTRKVGRQKGEKLRGFVFIGDSCPNPNNPKWIGMHGKTFGLNGKAVKVSGEAADKLAGNGHFKEV